VPRRHLAVGLVAAGCLGLLAACGGPLRAVTNWRTLPLMLHTDPAGVLGSAALQAAWALALWLAAGTVLHLAASLPGVAGRWAGVLARAITPRLLRRTLDVCLGVGLVAVPAGPALAAPGAPSASPRPAVSSAFPVVPAPVLAPLPLVPDLDRPAARAPAPASAAAPAAPPAPGSLAAPAAPPAPGSLAAPAAPPAPARPSAPLASPATKPVVVHTGDSLWSIARAELPSDGRSDAAVAASWPRWWRTNYAQIGDNPNVIQPGQQLTPPTGAGR